MIWLRLGLLAGLVFHKLLWEILRRQGSHTHTSQHSVSSLGRRLIKGAKGVVLAFLVLQTLCLDLWPILDHPFLLRIIGVTLYILGLAIAVRGRLQLGTNWVDLEDYQILQEQALVMDGIYHYIRHPIYTGDLLLLIGLELTLNSWLVLGVAIPLVVAVRQALAEDALLSQAFPGYSAYCAQTKRFIPFVV